MKLLLQLTGSTLAAYEWRQGRLHAAPVFAAGEAERFAAYLDTVPELPVQVLVDLADEEFRVESLPHLWGRDRRLLQERHSGRLYRHTPYRFTRTLWRDAGDRRRDEVLMGALTHPAVVDAWLEVLLHRGLPVTGLYSLPLVSERLMRRARLGEGEKLLWLTHNRHGGLRQSFFVKGRLCFSRLANVPAPEDSGYVAAVMQEIAKTKRYLNSLRHLEPDEVLPVCICCGEQTRAALAQVLDDHRRSYYRLLTVAELGRRLHLRLPESPYSDLLFLHGLHRLRMGPTYGRADQRRGHRTYLARQGLQAASVLLFLGAAVTGGVFVSDGLYDQHQARQSQAQAAQIQAAYDRVAARLPRTEASPAAIAATVRLAEALERGQVLPTPLLVRISRGMDSAPHIQLDAIEWRNSGAAMPTAQAVAMHTAGDPRDPGTVPAAARYGRQSAVLRGRIVPFDGDYLAAHRQVEAFAALLGRQQGIERVQVMRLPLDTDPDHSVEGRFGDTTQDQRAEFALRVTLGEGGRVL